MGVSFTSMRNPMGGTPMNVQISRRITIAEYLAQRGLPADWRFGSPLGRLAAEIYRRTYGREPGRAFRLLNGRFRPVMTYEPSETHVLTAAWEQYGCTADLPPVQPGRAVSPTGVRMPSGDAMRWTPTSGRLRSHP
ncbi:hypothetical protein KMT30_05875 [Streptomyces sp. IBSBF 2953]|nr:hypothetical protein [Streptomyces hayashii]